MEPAIRSSKSQQLGLVSRHRWRDLSRLFQSRLGQDTLWSGILKLAYIGLSFLSTVLLARLLGPAEYGIYAYIYALVGLLSVASQFGLPSLVLRETARGVTQGKYSAVRGIWRWSTYATMGISLGLVGLIGLVAFLLRHTFELRQITTLGWALALVPLVALIYLKGAALRGLRRVVLGQLPQFLVRPALFTVFLAVFGPLLGRTLNAPAAMALDTVAAVLSFGLAAWLLHCQTPLVMRATSPAYESKRWWTSAIPLAFISGMNLISQKATILTAGVFLQPAEIGLLRVAIQVATLASFGLQIVNMSIAPHFARLHAQGETHRLQILVTSSARGVLALNLVASVVFVALGEPFLTHAFGVAFGKAYIPLVILLAGQLVNAATGSVGLLLNMTGYEREAAWRVAVASTLGVFLTAWLTPELGVSGAAMAMAASMIIRNGLLWWAVRVHLDITSFAFGVPNAGVRHLSQG